MLVFSLSSALQGGNVMMLKLVFDRDPFAPLTIKLIISFWEKALEETEAGALETRRR